MVAAKQKHADVFKVIIDFGEIDIEMRDVEK